MGLHHITAIAREPQRNLDFYTGTLGMRLVKLTINYDDPGTYHLYYGDELGRPGSLLTFFAWTGGRPGRQGTGQTNGIGLAIPPSALGFWIERLLARGVRYEGPVRRFGEQVVSFADPDGVLLELIATPRAAAIEGWRDGPVPAEHAVRGIHGVTIWEDGDAGSAPFLAANMGFRQTGEDGNRLRFESADEGLGSVIELRRVQGFWGGTDGVGTVHHIAFRAADDAEQLSRRERIQEQGVGVTEVRDRTYFRSIYFREPGGVLYEIATDGPGFTVDEPVAALGTTLQLPGRYEAMRTRLEVALPTLRLTHAAAGG